MADEESAPTRADALVPGGHLRATDDDRNRMVELLRVAAGDGRLTLDELDERVGAALTARTYGELAVLVGDLPATPASPTGASGVKPRDELRIDCHSSSMRRDGRWMVPQLPDAGKPSAAPILQWLQRQHAQGDPLLVSVCTGAEVLASAGLLDGRPATSHWLGLIGLRRNYPAVRWTDGVRYVDDGDLITTAGVLSGVDGALRVVERMVGPAAAAQAARAVHWPYYSPGEPAAIRRSRPAPADVVAVLSAGYRWDRPHMGVLLTDGVGETELASAFRPYTELDQGGRVRDGPVQADAAEPAPADRVGDLAAQALVAELVAVLEVQQPQQGVDRDRRAAKALGEQLPPRGDEVLVVQVGVDRLQLDGQPRGLLGQQQLPDRGLWIGLA